MQDEESRQGETYEQAVARTGVVQLPDTTRDRLPEHDIEPGTAQ